MQQHIDFPMEISVLKYKLGNLVETPLFKIAIQNDQNTLEISS